MSPTRITIVHGEADSIIPVAMGRELAALDPERITFHGVPGADHNDLIGVAVEVILAAMR